MKRFCFAIAICMLLVITSLPSWAEPTSGPKINPYAVDYPLIRTAPYRKATGYLYESAFGVRRWLRPLRMAKNPMYEQTLSEAQAWFSRFGGYGVMGHGEDVFTAKGAQFRRTHRGH